MSNNKIANNLKKLRAKKGLSLEKIARLADLLLNTMSKIAMALEVGVDDLIK